MLNDNIKKLCVVSLGLLNGERMSTFPILNLCKKSVFVPAYSFSWGKQMPCQQGHLGFFFHLIDYICTQLIGMFIFVENRQKGDGNKILGQKR